MSSLFNSAWTALSSYLPNDNGYHRLESSDPPGHRAIRSVLARDRLNDPSLWHGYNDFIDIAPPERGQITLDKCADYFSAEVGRDRISRHRVPRGYPGFSDLNEPLYRRVLLHNVAPHYPVDRGNNQWKTICRWDLMTAWEILRQVALTRACLVEIVSQKDYPIEWTAPEPEILASLNDWAKAAREEFERLDDYLVFIHHFERIGRPPPQTWSLSESIPDRLADTYLMGGTGLHQLPCKLFDRLSRMLDGEDILSDRLTARSAAAVAGLIRALVQEFRPEQPYGTEPKVFAWWRKRLPHDQRLVKYADRSDLGLDVASRYRRVIDSWASSSVLIGIPESDSAEKVYKSLGGEPGNPESRSAEKVDGGVRSVIPESDSAGKIDKNLSRGIPASNSAEKVEQNLVLGSTKPLIRSKDASMATQKDSLLP